MDTVGHGHRWTGSLVVGDADGCGHWCTWMLGDMDTGGQGHWCFSGPWQVLASVVPGCLDLFRLFDVKLWTKYFADSSLVVSESRSRLFNFTTVRVSPPSSA